MTASQLSISSNNPTICNPSTFQCQQRDLQSRTQCGIVKPLCPVLKFSCSLCNFYLSTKTCKRICQKYKKYCGSSSGCSSSPPIITGPSPAEFKKGTCINSKFLGSTWVHDKWDCLEKCQSHAECHYATWRPSDTSISNKGVCILFQTCSKLQKSSSCKDCQTTTSIARCDKSGVCQVFSI